MYDGLFLVVKNRVVYILLFIIENITSIMIGTFSESALYIHIYYIEYAILDLW